MKVINQKEVCDENIENVCWLKSFHWNEGVSKPAFIHWLTTK